MIKKFKFGDRVKGVYQRYRILHDPDTREPVEYTGTIIHDFEDESYEVQFPTGESLLIELYDEDTMELDETL